MVLELLLKLLGAALAGGATAYALIMPIITSVLAFIGFTSGGVAMGSMAAAAQTSTIASGSLFASLQALGATGAAALAPVAPIIAGILGAIGSVIIALFI